MRRSASPRLVGAVLVAVGVVLALILALRQSEPAAMLGEWGIFAIGLGAVLAIAIGLFMLIRNRAVRGPGPGVRGPGAG